MVSDMVCFYIGVFRLFFVFYLNFILPHVFKTGQIIPFELNNFPWKEKRAAVLTMLVIHKSLLLVHESVVEGAGGTSLYNTMICIFH